MKPTKCRIMCPDCGRQKMLFDTEKAAQGFIKFNYSEITNDPDNLRVYYCPSCCGYHISSKEHRNSYDNRTEHLLNAYHNDIHAKEQCKEERIEKCYKNFVKFLKTLDDQTFTFKKPVFQKNYKYIVLDDQENINLFDQNNKKTGTLKLLTYNQLLTLWSCVLQQQKINNIDMSLYEKILNSVQKGIKNALNENIKYGKNDLILAMPQGDELWYPFTKEHKFDSTKDNDGTSLANLSKKQVQKNDKLEIYYQFGKNGQGISTEIVEIGKDLERLSKRWHLYLGYPHFDTVDDVYDFKVYGIKRKENEILEGAWGYEYNKSDQFLDYTAKVGKLMFNEIINDGNIYLKEKEYWYCYIILGLITDLLQIENFSEMFRYVIDKKQRDGKSFETGSKLYDLAEKIIEFLESDKDNVSGWDNFEKYKKTLNNLIKLYKKRIKKFEVKYEK